MSEQNKKPELVFMPGCFDNFDGTQEELDEMVAEIQRLVDSGELFERAVPIDMDAILEDLSAEDIVEILNEVEDPTPRTLQ